MLVLESRAIARDSCKRIDCRVADRNIHRVRWDRPIREPIMSKFRELRSLQFSLADSTSHVREHSLTRILFLFLLIENSLLTKQNVAKVRRFMMGGQWYNDNNRHIQKNILGANVKNPNNAERTSLYTHELQPCRVIKPTVLFIWTGVCAAVPEFESIVYTTSKRF